MNDQLPLYYTTQSFNIEQFQNACACFLQFEISHKVVTCNANFGGLDAFMQFIDTLPKNTGMYEVPQWPYQPWSWKTPKIERIEQQYDSFTTYRAYPLQSNTPRNKIAKKVFLHRLDDHHRVLLQLTVQTQEVHIYVSSQGLQQFRDLIQTSRHTCPFFLVVKAKPQSHHLLKIQLTGAWDNENDIDILEFRCLEPKSPPRMECSFGRICGNSSGYFWFMQKLLQFAQSTKKSTLLQLPIDKEHFFKSELKKEEDTVLDIEIIKRRRTYVHVPTFPYQIYSEASNSAASIQIIKKNIPIQKPLISYAFCNKIKPALIETNTCGLHVLLHLFDYFMFEPNEHDHLPLYERRQLAHIAQGDLSIIDQPSGINLTFDGGYIDEYQDIMTKTQQYEPITGLPLPKEKIESSQYVTANTLHQIPPLSERPHPNIYSYLLAPLLPSNIKELV